MAGTLWLVGTPIGNLGDLSDRARDVLGSAGRIACEDTRRTGKLLAHFGLSGRLVSFFEGNEVRRTRELVGLLQEGIDVALVSDAGMPGISDPGERLVRACIAAHIDVRVVPGPSAALAAQVISGLPARRFVFEGFLPRRAAARRERLEALANDPRTVVLFESPRRAAATLRDIANVFGTRPAIVGRELTKRHEEVLRGTALDLAARLESSPPRGEVVIVVGGAVPGNVDEETLVAEAVALHAAGRRKREAAAEVATRYGVSVNRVYRLMTESS